MRSILLYLVQHDSATLITVAESVKTMRGRGVELKADFRKVRFDDRSMPLNAPIHHNKILLPSNPSNVNPKKQVVMSKAKDIDLT